MRRALVASLLFLLAAGAPAPAAVPGALDGSYGSCGFMRSPLRGLFGNDPALVRLPDGSLVAVSIGSTHGSAVGTVRLMPDGRLDTAYGNHGTARVQFPIDHSDLYMTAAALAPGGRIVLAGYWSDYPGYGVFLARLAPDGSLDPSFGSGGLVSSAVPNAKDVRAYGLDVDAAGRVVIAGVRDGRAMVARFTPDGKPEAAFGGTGVVTVAFPGAKSSELRAVRIAPDGTIVAAGRAAKQFALVRLRDDGTLDPTFGTNGTALGSVPAAATAQALLPLDDGRLVAAGTGENINGDQQVVARFGANGAQDMAFAGAGSAFSRATDHAKQIVAAADGSLLVAGQGIARYRADGAPDTSFGLRGSIGSSFPVGGLALLHDGAAIAAVQVDNRLAVARYAVAGPALDALRDQGALCAPVLNSKRLRGLLNTSYWYYGDVSFHFSALEPTRATWSATATVGKHRYSLGRIATRTSYSGGVDEELPLSRRAYRRLRRARSARVTLTGRDPAGHTVTVERELHR